MKLLAALLLSLSLLVAGCGDDEEQDESASTTTARTQTQPGATTEAEPPPAASSEEDEEAVQDVVKEWLLEGDCDNMTDKFLDAQLVGLGDNREERCDLFEKQFQKPQYGEDQIQISDVEVSGTKASLVVGSENAPDIESRYDLVKTGDRWQIDAAELQ